VYPNCRRTFSSCRSAAMVEARMQLRQLAEGSAAARMMENVRHPLAEIWEQLETWPTAAVVRRATSANIRALTISRITRLSEIIWEAAASHTHHTVPAPFPKNLPLPARDLDSPSTCNTLFPMTHLLEQHPLATQSLH